MQTLNLPSYDYKLRKKNGKVEIWDTQRKKYIVLSPEEWVRQHFIYYLINTKQFPGGLIQVESKLKFKMLDKRSDIIVYDKTAQPLILIECKAPSIKITQQTFDQVTIYNQIIKAPYIIVTNGLTHYCCKIDLAKKEFVFLPDIPPFTEISA